MSDAQPRHNILLIEDRESLRQVYEQEKDLILQNKKISGSDDGMTILNKRLQKPRRSTRATLM